MKYLILSLLVICSIFIGYFFSKKYRIRAKFFNSLIYLCLKFDVEINYSRERLKNIIESLDEKHKQNLYGIDKNFILFINDKTPLEKEMLFKGINFLKEDEKDVIFMFFKTLGRSDVDSQSKEIKNYQTKFEEISAQTTAENKKYGSLSIKLGIIAGLFLVVILI